MNGEKGDAVRFLNAREARDIELVCSTYIREWMFSRTSKGKKSRKGLTDEKFQ